MLNLPDLDNSSKDVTIIGIGGFHKISTLSCSQT
jgi:hypothetical protein